MNYREDKPVINAEERRGKNNNTRKQGRKQEKKDKCKTRKRWKKRERHGEIYSKTKGKKIYIYDGGKKGKKGEQEEKAINKRKCTRETKGRKKNGRGGEERQRERRKEYKWQE